MERRLTVVITGASAGIGRAVAALVLPEAPAAAARLRDAC